MRTVPRIGRLLDLTGLLVFASGAAVFARSWAGFRSVPGYVPPPGGPPWAAVGVADGYWRLQKIGTIFMIAGVVIFVLAWWSVRSPGRSGAGPEGGPPGT